MHIYAFAVVHLQTGLFVTCHGGTRVCTTLLFATSKYSMLCFFATVTGCAGLPPPLSAEKHAAWPAVCSYAAVGTTCQAVCAQGYNASVPPAVSECRRQRYGHKLYPAAWQAPTGPGCGQVDAYEAQLVFTGGAQLLSFPSRREQLKQVIWLALGLPDYPLSSIEILSVDVTNATASGGAAHTARSGFDLPDTGSYPRFSAIVRVKLYQARRTSLDVLKSIWTDNFSSKVSSAVGRVQPRLIAADDGSSKGKCRWVAPVHGMKIEKVYIHAFNHVKYAVVIQLYWPRAWQDIR